MPLFVKQNKAVLYVHVPKTGGTTIEKFFSRNGFAVSYLDTGGPKSLNKYARCPPQHMHADLIATLLKPAKFDLVLMTVRDPLARLLSEYKMRMRTGNDPLSLPAWTELMFKRYLDDPYTADNHIRPQAEFWLPGCDVFRQEEGFGAALAARVEQKLDITLEHPVTGTFNADKESTLDPRHIARIAPLVQQFYHQDYAMFGYKPA